MDALGVNRISMVWRVIEVDAVGHGHGDCGHEHADDLDAVRCSWTPEPWPERCDLLVRQVRAGQTYQLGLRP